MQIDLPGNDGNGVAPAGRAVKARIEFRLLPRRVGHYMGHRAVFALVGHDVADIFGQEILGIGQVERRAGKHLRVAGPAQPLVALRAVGRHFDEIAALAPQRIEHQPVHQRTAGGKAGGLLGHRTDRHRGHIGHRGLPAHRDARIAIALEGEMGPVMLHAAAGQRIFRHRLGGTEVDIVEIAVLVEHFGMLDRHHGARRTTDGIGNIATHILPEIVHHAALRIGPALDRRQRRQLTHRCRLMRDQYRSVIVQHSGAGRYDRRHPRIIALAEIDARFADRQLAALPAVIGRQQGCSVGGAGPQLGNGGNILAPGIDDGMLAPHERRAQPAIGQPDLDGVFAGLQQVADRIGLK